MATTMCTSVRWVRTLLKCCATVQKRMTFYHKLDKTMMNGFIAGLLPTMSMLSAALAYNCLSRQTKISAVFESSLQNLCSGECAVISSVRSSAS